MFQWLNTLPCVGARDDVADLESAIPDDSSTPFEAIQAGGVDGTFKAWLQTLPFPPPVTFGIVSGGICGSFVGFWMFVGGFIVISVIMPTLNAWLMRVIGRWLKAYIEEVDREYIGVDVHIGKIDLSICYARVVIHNLQIDNPEGYQSQHLMYAKQLTLDLDLLELLRTRGQHVVVEEFKLEQLDAIIEFKNVVWGIGESNIQAVQDFVSGPAHPQDPENGAGSAKTTPRASSTPRNSARSPKGDPPTLDKEEKPKSHREYTLMKVEFVDISAMPFAKLGAGAAIHCADLRFKHFSEEFNTYGGADLMVCLVKSLTKSILMNMVGKKF
mmetsp:Transcript_73122/g.141446  ORF Transcript_73122/g.141446 Transcript_73122/m.141446 type:complete len:328 (-) Transcript_73122:111-1094(-)